MMTLEKIRNALQDRRLLMIAEATGVHYNTIKKVRDNPKANPTHQVLRLLSDYLEGK